MSKSAKKGVIIGLGVLSIIILAGILFIKGQNKNIPFQFQVQDVESINVYGIATESITNISKIKEVKNYYNQIDVLEKIDSTIEEPCTPDYGMSIILKSGDIIDINFFDNIYISRVNKTSSGYVKEKYTYICKQEKLNEFILSLSK